MIQLEIVPFRSFGDLNFGMSNEQVKLIIDQMGSPGNTKDNLQYFDDHIYTWQLMQENFESQEFFYHPFYQGQSLRGMDLKDFYLWVESYDKDIFYCQEYGISANLGIHFSGVFNDVTEVKYTDTIGIYNQKMRFCEIPIIPFSSVGSLKKGMKADLVRNTLKNDGFNLEKSRSGSDEFCSNENASFRVEYHDETKECISVLFYPISKGCYSTAMPTVNGQYILGRRQGNFSRLSAFDEVEKIYLPSQGVELLMDWSEAIYEEDDSIVSMVRVYLDKKLFDETFENTLE